MRGGREWWGLADLRWAPKGWTSWCMVPRYAAVNECTGVI
jgi:hypothetical protein